MLSDSALILASSPLRVVCRSACAVVTGAEAQVNVELMGEAQRLIGAIVGDLLQLAHRSAMLARSERGISLRRISAPSPFRD